MQLKCQLSQPYAVRPMPVRVSIQCTLSNICGHIISPLDCFVEFTDLYYSYDRRAQKSKMAALL